MVPIQLTTKRLTLSPMTESEMEALIARYQSYIPELSKAYGEMLDGCRAHPDEYAWYCAWKIILTQSGAEVGDADFKGFRGGRPEIGYGLNEEYQGQGFATEAVTALCGWAFSMPGVTAVEAETDPDNEKSKRVLAKAGFLPTGELGEEGPRFCLNRPL